MVDWKAGDRFKLECEGEIIQYKEGRSDFQADVVEILLDGKPKPMVALPDWFDAHATKIQRPFQFGDRVMVIRDSDGGRVEGVVIDISGHFPDVFMQSGVRVNAIHPNRLTLIESQEDK